VRRILAGLAGRLLGWDDAPTVGLPGASDDRAVPGQSTPTVSVLPPVRDDRFLEQCVASLRRQTLRELEVVAVDDGSRDGSGELLDAWASQDPRVRVVHHRPAA
jgi:cellulose synthase/poly-beta-1,6-N-acetylglucosamine synthase-like glycosyltransferase